MSHLQIQNKNETTAGKAVSRLKLHWQAKLRSIDSCQNGTCANHYQKTNNEGSGSLRYTIWHFPLHGKMDGNALLTLVVC